MKPVQILSCFIALTGLLIGTGEANAQSFKKYLKSSSSSQKNFKYIPKSKLRLPQSSTPKFNGLPSPQGMAKHQPQFKKPNLTKKPQLNSPVIPQFTPKQPMMPKLPDYVKKPNKPWIPPQGNFNPKLVPEKLPKLPLQPLLPGPQVIPVPPVLPKPPVKPLPIPIPYPIPQPMPTPQPCPSPVPGGCVAPAQPVLGVYLMPVTLPVPGGHVQGLKVTSVYRHRPLYGQDAFGTQREYRFRSGADIILGINGSPVSQIADVRATLTFGWNTLSIWDSQTHAFGQYQIFID